MWIVAGPNGAGKSTFAAQFLPGLGLAGLVKLNADVRTLELRSKFPSAALHDLNLQAAIETDDAVRACISSGCDFAVETVLSSDKYRDDVLTAKAKGFKIGLIYISLYPPELSPQRVSERVAKGGHDVAPATAIARHTRSHDQLRWFAAEADFLLAFDNSSPDGAPVMLATRTAGQPLQYRARGVNPAVDLALSDLA